MTTTAEDHLKSQRERDEDVMVQAMTDVLADLRDELAGMKSEIAGMRKDIDASKTFIEKIMGEVGPVLEKLQGSGMFKMMFGGK
jgi:archaellum component FlaC